MPPLVDWGNAGLTVVGLIASATTAKLGAVGASGTGLQLAVARRVEEGVSKGYWFMAISFCRAVTRWVLELRFDSHSFEHHYFPLASPLTSQFNQ